MTTTADVFAAALDETTDVVSALTTAATPPETCASTVRDTGARCPNQPRWVAWVTDDHHNHPRTPREVGLCDICMEWIRAGRMTCTYGPTVVIRVITSARIPRHRSAA